MQRATLWTLGAVVAAIGLPGCKTGGDGPVPQSLLDSRSYWQQGIAAMERGQWTQGESLAAKAVATCPVDSDARRHYAEALWHRGACDEALQQMEAACRLTHDDAGLHARVAQMRLALHQNEAARVQVLQALDLDPRLAAAWTVAAQISRADGQLRQALTEYQRALAYAPDDRQVLLESAQLYLELAEPQRALMTLQNLCDTYPPGEEPQDTLALLATAYTAVGRYDDAVDSLTAALARGPAQPELQRRLAEVQARQGQPNPAVAALHYARE